MKQRRGQDQLLVSWLSFCFLCCLHVTNKHTKYHTKQCKARSTIRFYLVNGEERKGHISKQSHFFDYASYYMSFKHEEICLDVRLNLNV